MMMRLRPTMSILLDRVAPRALKDDAVESTEIYPASQTVNLPAIALPNELERVVTFDDTQPGDQLRWLRQGVSTHPATTAFRLKDALIYDGFVYSKRARQLIRKRSKSPIVKGPIATLNDGQLCTYTYVERYFAHWLVEGLYLEMISADRGLTPITIERKPWLSEPGLREIIGLVPHPVSQAHVGSLWIVDFCPMNDGRTAQLKKLREALRATVPKDGPELVFIKRGRTGLPRNLVNEASLIDALVTRGFAIVEPEHELPGNLIRKLANAKIVVGVEGSAMFNAVLMMPDHGVVLNIQPPTRFAAFAKIFTDALGMRFAYTVADPHPEGFFQPIDALMRTIDASEKALG